MQVEAGDQKANRLPIELRAQIRSGAITGQTSGMANGYVQANLAIMPKVWADDFLEFCLVNPKSCPLVAVGKPGDPSLPLIGADIDIRTDVPKYCVLREGVKTEETNDITSLWGDDFVTFAIGCSFSFEGALLRAGISVRHIELGRNVPMFRTSIPCASAGRFSGNLVVSMRPMKPDDALRAIQITGEMPQVHGSPVHIGYPEQIGITNVSQPDYGESVPIGEGELPVFWACGVTPQLAIAQAKPPIAITHSPGCMLITDIKDEDLLNGNFRFEC